MAWDFSTDPEFQPELDWMDAFVREEVWPLESIYDELGHRFLPGSDPAAAPGGIPSEHLPTRRAAARQRFADVLEAVTSND